MGKSDSHVWQQGLLLVEAVLAAVVIATGLVFISRGLGGQLRALRFVEQYDDLLPIAEGKLNELEAWGLRWEGIPSTQQEGSFKEAPSCRWRMSASARSAASDAPTLSDVTLKVWCGEENGSRQTVLRAVWPAAWIES